jgi:hypothetical protein
LEGPETWRLAIQVCDGAGDPNTAQTKTAIARATRNGTANSPKFIDHPNCISDSPALPLILAQHLSRLSIDEMQCSAGKAGNRLVLVIGNIWIIVQFVLDVEAGRRTRKN